MSTLGPDSAVAACRRPVDPSSSQEQLPAHDRHLGCGRRGQRHRGAPARAQSLAHAGREPQAGAEIVVAVAGSEPLRARGQDAADVGRRTSFTPSPSGLYVGLGGLICRNWPYGRRAGAKLPPGSHPASNATRWPDPGRVGECAERLQSCSRSSEPELLPGLCLCRAREHPRTKPSSSRFGLKRSGHSRSINGAAGGRSSARRPTAGQGLRSTCDPRSASAIARPGCPTTPSSSGSVILTWSTRKPGPSAEVGRSESGG